MITLNNISFAVGDKQILNKISLDVGKGEFVALIGANGSGKSTLVKTIDRTLTKQSGEIIIKGKQQEAYKHKEFAQVVSTMSQQNKVVEELSVYDVVSYGRLPYKSVFSSVCDDDRKIIDDALKQTGLSELQERMVTSLSGGELQRVHLAACIAQQPEILILDEPTNHLDVKHQYKILDLVKQNVIDKGLTVLCVLHDMNQAIKYADKIVVIEKGEIYKQGTPIEVIDEQLIEQVFEIKAKVYRDHDLLHIDFVGVLD